VYKYWVVFFVIFITNVQADSGIDNKSIDVNSNGLVEISDAELELVSGQTGTPEQLKQSIDQTVGKGSDYQQATVREEAYTEPPKVTTYFNGAKL